MKSYTKINKKNDFIIRCRHSLISKYFGEDNMPNCIKSCDACKDQKKLALMLDQFKVC